MNTGGDGWLGASRTRHEPPTMADCLPVVCELIGHQITAVDLDPHAMGIGEGGFVLTLDDGRRLVFHGQYDEGTVARFL